MKQIFLVFAVSLLAACGWGAGSESAIGLVESVEGQPRVFRGQRYLQLGPRSAIEIGDSVITGAADKVEVEFHDGTILQIGHDAQLTIQEYMRATLKITSSGGRYRLTTGKYFKRAETGVEISIPFGSVYSGKTDLYLEHAADSQSLKLVQLGGDAITVENQFGTTQLLERGDSSTLSFGQLPSGPEPLKD